MTNHRCVKLYEGQDTKKQNSKCTELMLWTVGVVQAHQPHFTPDIWEQSRNVFYISLVFSNACHVLSQCNTRSTCRLLYYFVNFNTISLIKRSPTAAILHISSAPVILDCSQNLSKLTNQRVYHILVNQKDLLLSLPTGILSLLLAMSLLFCHMLFFHAAPKLTECLKRLLIIFTILLTIPISFLVIKFPLNSFFFLTSSLMVN